MKVAFVFMTAVCILLLLPACHLPGNSYAETPLTARDSATAAKFKFDRKDYLFGEVKAGSLVTYSFKFVNVGESPLIIRDIYTSCGCTVTSYDHTPVAVGKEGNIKVVFNTEGKSGIQRKIVTITANTIPRLSQVAMAGIVK